MAPAQDPQEPLVFAICDMSDIPPGAAKGFSLLQRDKSGAVRPLALVVVHTRDHRYFAYANRCPHTGVWLNIRNGEYLSESGDALVCSRHGARFCFDSGQCLEGPCEGQMLDSYPVAAIAGDICLIGVDLVEMDDEAEAATAGADETLEITVAPE